MNRHSVSRRDFLKTSAAGASLLALGVPGVSRGFAANEKAQIGWLGVGGRGTQLLTDFVAHCPDGRIAAVCDLIPDRLERGRKIAEKDRPNGYTDYREMIDKEKLDGIATIVACCDHAKVTVPVLDAGYHCFGEKPLDITVEKIDELTVAARRAWKEKGKFFQIGTQRRYHPGYLACMKEIHDGLIGKVIFMQGGWHWSGDPSGAPIDRDGGRLIEQASHHMDVMAWAMKDRHPLTCVAMASAQNEDKFPGPNKFSETHSATIFQFPGNVLFSYTHLHGLPGKYDKEILNVFGEKGCVDLNQARYIGRDEKEKQIAEPSGKDWGKGTIEELQDFVANIRTGGKRLPNANIETGRICSLMCVMGRMAMVNKEKNAYEPRVIRWADLGTKTDL